MPEQDLYMYAYYVRTNIQGVQRYAEITKEKKVFMGKKRNKGFLGQEGKGTPQKAYLSVD